MDDTGSSQSRDIDYVKKKFEKALELHETGNFDEAASAYQNLLQTHPLNSLLLNSYGTLLYQQGNLLDGPYIIKKSIILNSNTSIFYNRLGVIKRTQGDLDGARKMFTRALFIEEQYEANLNLCETYLEQRHPEAALAPGRRALALAPNAFLPHLRLATALRLVGKFNEALAEVEEAKSLNPLSPDPYIELTMSNIGAEKGEAALNAVVRGLILAPDRLDNYFNLLGSLNIWSEGEGKTSQLSAEPESLAIKRLDIPFWGRCAIVTNRQNPLIWFWHGVNCGRSNLLAEGLSSLKRSILIDPAHGNSYQAISVMFQRSGALEKAYFFAKVTKRLFINIGGSPHILWETCFALGKEEKGWEYWAGRFDYDGAVERRGLPTKRWRQIEKLDGKLLVCSEQGIGDEILYLSCLPDLLKQHKAIVVECDKRWGPIFRRSFPEIIVVPRQVKFVGDDSLFYDYSEITRKYKIGAYMLCGDLPKIFRYDFQTPKNESGFLRSNPQRRQVYSKYLDKPPGQVLVGVCWKSGFAPNWPSIYPRLSDLLEFLPNDKNLRLISLQYGRNDRELAAKSKNTAKLETIPDLDQVEDLEGVAALISSLDLVISASTTVLHLACALGVKTISTYYPNFRSTRGADPMFENCYPMLDANEVFCSRKVSERIGNSVREYLSSGKVESFKVFHKVGN
tara:strand:+ start:868 stop:2907 length:2040 start_codon:yes stop_codon:yes gene_type:complete